MKLLKYLIHKLYYFCSKNHTEVLLHPLSVLLDYSVLPSNQTVMLTQSDVIQQFPTDWVICNEISDALADEIQMASVCTAVTPITLALFGGSYKICTALQNQKTGAFFFLFWKLYCKRRYYKILLPMEFFT